jgi:hypothetical protein
MVSCRCVASGSISSAVVDPSSGAGLPQWWNQRYDKRCVRDCDISGHVKGDRVLSQAVRLGILRNKECRVLTCGLAKKAYGRRLHPQQRRPPHPHRLIHSSQGIAAEQGRKHYAGCSGAGNVVSYCMCNVRSQLREGGGTRGGGGQERPPQNLSLGQTSL